MRTLLRKLLSRTSWILVWNLKRKPFLKWPLNLLKKSVAVDYRHLKIISTSFGYHIGKFFVKSRKPSSYQKSFWSIQIKMNYIKNWWKLMTASQNYGPFFGKDYRTETHDIVFEISSHEQSWQKLLFANRLLTHPQQKRKWNWKKLNASSGSWTIVRSNFQTINCLFSLRYTAVLWYWCIVTHVIKWTHLFY